MTTASTFLSFPQDNDDNDDDDDDYDEGEEGNNRHVVGDDSRKQRQQQQQQQRDSDNSTNNNSSSSSSSKKETISITVDALRLFLNDYRAEIVQECKQEMVSLLASSSSQQQQQQEEDDGDPSSSSSSSSSSQRQDPSHALKQQQQQQQQQDQPGEGEEGGSSTAVTSAAATAAAVSSPMPVLRSGIESKEPSSSWTLFVAAAHEEEAAATASPSSSSHAEEGRTLPVMMKRVYFNAQEEDEDNNSNNDKEEENEEAKTLRHPTSSGSNSDVVSPTTIITATTTTSNNNCNSPTPSTSGNNSGGYSSPRGNNNNSGLTSLFRMGRNLSGLQGTTISNQEYWLLEHDTFTMLFLSDVTSTSFSYAILVTTIQFFTLSLICWDLFYDKYRKQNQIDVNPFNIPIFVNDQVSMAQCIALIIAVISQDDMRNSIVLLVNGYREEELLVGTTGTTPRSTTTTTARSSSSSGGDGSGSGPTDRDRHPPHPPPRGRRCGRRARRRLGGVFPGATKMKWIISNLLRLVEGIMVVFVSFTFIVQASTVLDIFLNFAAVVFVSELDNLAFILARNGYITNEIMDQAKKIQKSKIPKRIQYIFLQRILILVPFIPSFIFWGIHFHYQRTGQNLEASACRIVHVQWSSKVIYPLPSTVQFETTTTNNNSNSTNTNTNTNTTTLGKTDRIISSNFQTKAPPALDYSFFSGYYHVDFSQPLVNRRPVYREKGSTDPTAGLIYYCFEERAWVFTIPAFLKTGTGSGGSISSSSAIPEETTRICGLGRGIPKRIGYLWVSPVTDSFTLEEVPMMNGGDWTAYTGSLQTVPSSDLSISCMDCYRDSECGFGNGKCQHDTRRCDCGDRDDSSGSSSTGSSTSISFGGPKCDVQPHCQEIHLFLPGFCHFSFGAIPGIYVQNRPVYVVTSKEEEEESLTEEIPFVFVYLGRRWYLLEIPIPLQNDLFARNDPVHVNGLHEDEATGGGRKSIERIQDTWWNETGTTAIHGYWNAMTTPPTAVWAFSDLTDSYEPFVDTRMDNLAWFAGKRGQRAAAGAGGGQYFLQQMSLECQDVNRLQTCETNTMCDVYQVCQSCNTTTTTTTSSNGSNSNDIHKCVCPEGTFGEFCENMIGNCTILEKE